ncbi:ABC transporter ATP-binding protein [Streptomyces sp. NPDC029041]|uniref:ABC transporter ATP-binding protein n=1 Tax=Streptomyces sp. NPDC029041 TaxID=3155727 RepID=UPI00340DE2DD
MTVTDREKSAASDGDSVTAIPHSTPDNGSGRQDLISAQNVTVRFGGLVALSDISISVPRGSIVGLVGPNGAGKSTLFNVISGLVRPDAGQILLEGADITDSSVQTRARLGIGRTFQRPEMFVSLTVRENITLAYRMRHARSRLWRDLLLPARSRAAGAEEERAVSEAITLVGLKSVEHARAAGLPLGHARRVEMARAIVMAPKAILLDEPSSGLDPTETAQFSRMLTMLSGERDIGLLLVEHNVGMVLDLCQRIHVLDFGVGIAAGPPEEIRHSEAVHAAYFGHAEAAEGGAF